MSIIANDRTQSILSRLQQVKPTGAGKWSACCPSHNDKTPSLSISTGNDGRTLVNCFSGCTTENIVAALGLKMVDLFPPSDRPQPANRNPAPRTYPTWDAAIRAVGHHLGTPSGTWEYCDATGDMVAVVGRWDGTEGKTFRPASRHGDAWRIGDPPGKWPIYRLPAVMASDGPVYVTEGERCADMAGRLGLIATTSAHGAQSPGKSDWSPLAGRDVIILPDADPAGAKYAGTVAAILTGLTPPARVKIVALPGMTDGEDIVDFVARREEDGHDDPEVVQEIRDLAKLIAWAKPQPPESVFQMVATTSPDWHAQPAVSESAPPPQPPQRVGWTWSAVDSTAFAERAKKPEWLVKQILVKGQPAIGGGPKKSLKTSILADLVISLGSGTSFLGTFPVPRRVRTAILSGESGEWTLYETACRICAAKGIPMTREAVDVLWDFCLPQLSNLEDLTELRRGLERDRVEVLVLDPVYLCLLGAGSTAQAANLFEIGPLLASVSRVCRDVGCTPILLHHARKNLTNPHSPMDLEDLSHAGFQEFARQWLLVNRMLPYVPGSGRHELWLSAGGSVGFSSLYSLSIDEGVIADDFSGRKWEVSVTNASDAIDQLQSSKAEEKEKKADAAKKKKNQAADTRFLMTLDKIDPGQAGVTVRSVRDHLGWSGDATRTTVARLTDEGIIVAIDVIATNAAGHNRTAPGIRRSPVDPIASGTTGTNSGFLPLCPGP